MFFLFLSLSLLSCQGEKPSEAPTETPAPNTPHQNDKSDLFKSNSQGITEDYINTNRVIWQKPNMIIELLGDLENKTVADIGAGTGFFTLRLTPRAKKVIAIDVDRRFIDYLDSVKVFELPENIQSRLETRLVPPTDPQLAPEEVDAILIVNTYMYIKDRVDYLAKLSRSITPGGKLLIVDFKKKRTPIGPPSNIRIPVFQVEQELYDAGYTDIVINDTALDYQYMILAHKKTTHKASN